MKQEFDYVIVGGGSAGCALANRLTADGRYQVLLIEAGPDRESFWVRTPAGVPFLYSNKQINWMYSSSEEPNLGGRKIFHPRGKLLGGTSAINGMVYVRGNSGDYDGWQERGNRGWSSKDTLTYFRQMETNLDFQDEYHGTTGPLRVAGARFRIPVVDAFVDAGVSAGHYRNPDPNGARQDGMAHYQFSIDGGVRNSAARAFLKEARRRPNLSIMDQATVISLMIERGSVVGARYERGGDIHEVRAQEVLLSGGAINSPQLLMLSGIGPAAALEACGIPVVHDLPGVGLNLQDHLSIALNYETRPGMSLNAALSGPQKYMNGARYLLTKSGPLSLGTSQACAFLHTDPSTRLPDIQISFRAWSFDFTGGRLKMHNFPGVQAVAILLHPESTGAIRLDRNNPRGPPIIQMNYLSAPSDVGVMIRGIRAMRSIAATKTFQSVMIREMVPGSTRESASDLTDYIRQNAQSVYHPIGTCMMGQGPDAVVDERLRVHGVPGVRVIDASIMPTITSANTNAPTMMIGERAADLVLEDA